MGGGRKETFIAEDQFLMGLMVLAKTTPITKLKIALRNGELYKGNQEEKEDDDDEVIETVRVIEPMSESEEKNIKREDD